MADKTGIEWCDATWNPVVGCSVHSPGCIHCYAMPLAARLERMGNPAYAGLTQPSKTGPVWNGIVRLNPSTLEQPLRWKKPRRIFVNSMSDLFHENLADDAIDEVFGVMGACEDAGLGHTFIILTKRAERMQQYMARRAAQAWNSRRLGPDAHPPRNIICGVSAEDQTRWDERLAHLRETNALYRAVSVEPMIGPIEPSAEDMLALDWVIVGGESGPKARPMHPDWVRDIRDLCQVAGVYFFFKQWGEWLAGEGNYGQFDATPMSAYRRCDNHRYEWPRYTAANNFGTHPDPWSGPIAARRVGKKAAGAMLDGVEHREFPQL